MKTGFHTDAFNSACWFFDKCLARARRNGVHHIECGLIDGVLSIECEGRGGPMSGQSLAWLRRTRDELRIPHE